MSACDVHGQAAGLDEDAVDPAVLRAEKPLGHAQILVDVRCGREHDTPEPPGQVAREVVVDGAGAEQDQLRQLESQTWARFGPDLLQRCDDGSRKVLGQTTTPAVLFRYMSVGTLYAICHA